MCEKKRILQQFLAAVMLLWSEELELVFYTIKFLTRFLQRLYKMCCCAKK